MKLYGCSFIESLKIINDDFGLGLGTNYPNIKRIKVLQKQILEQPVEEEKPQVFTYTELPFTEVENSYWKSFNINEYLLELYNVRKVNEIFLNNKPYMKSTEDDPIFVYVFEEGSLKFYRPLAKNKANK